MTTDSTKIISSEIGDIFATDILAGVPIGPTIETLEPLAPAVNPSVPGSNEFNVITGTDEDDTLDGTGQADLIRGNDGDDRITAGGGNDRVLGGNGNDVIDGGAGDDILRGQDGNDVIKGGAGADTIEGGSGRDTASYAGSGAAVQVALNVGDQPQSGGDAQGDVLSGIENVRGSDFDDMITGNNGANVLEGGAGNDTLDGRGGADTVSGGTGDDLIIAVNSSGRTFNGNSGNDTLRITNGENLRNDTVTSIENLEIDVSGNTAKVILGASQAADLTSISIVSENDTAVTVDVSADDTGDIDLSGVVLEGFDDTRDRFDLIGSGQNNSIIGTQIDDFVRAGGGNDVVFGGAGNDDVRAGNGDDRITGGVGDDFLRGEDGNDTINGGAGADTIEGGSGRDTVSYLGSGAAVQVSLNQGDQPQSGGYAQGDVLRTIENVRGTAFDDTITGNNTANRLEGGAGNDTLEGKGGADEIKGGAGDDLIIAVNGSGRVFNGNSGNDTLRIISNDNLRNDTLVSIENIEIEAVAGRNALVQLNESQAEVESISFTSVNGRSATVEIFGEGGPKLDLSEIVLEGFVDDRDLFHFKGLSGRDIFTGSALGDRIDSAGGDDILSAGAGDDDVRAGNGNDRVFGGEGNDDVRAGNGDDVIDGGTGDDFLRGEDGNDLIEGGAGADTIEGGSGRDTASYAGSDAAVQIALNVGGQPQSGGDAQGDVLRTIENIVGSDFDDTITGNNTANRLEGGAGNDTFEGGGGIDDIRGGDGDDLIIAQNGSGRTFNGGSDNDTLRVISNDNLRNDTLISIENIEIEAVAGRNAVIEINGSQAANLETITFIPQNGRSATVDVFAEDETVVDFSDVLLDGFDNEDTFRFFGDGDGETFTGTAFGDRIEVRGGNDVLFGGAGGDGLFGGDGDDLLIGGAGSDRLDGGSGEDRVDYSASEEGIDVVLNNSDRRGDGGDAAGDRLVSIENVTGSDFDDIILGSNAANRIETGAGNDSIGGLGGDDRLDGGDGNDRINGGSGRDLLIGGDGDDVLNGGAASDTFRFTEASGFGNDVIRDFDDGELIELLREDGVNGFDDLQIAQVVVDLGNGDTRTDTVIELDRGSITLQDIDFTLGEANFDFF